MSNWQRLDTKIVYQNPYFSVHEDNVIRPDGKTVQYGWLETPPSVYVVAVQEDGKVVMVKQLRYLTGQPTWELPAGSMVVDDEDEEAAAKRELEQQAGLHADKWVRLSGEYRVWTGVATQRNTVLIASDLHKAKAPEPTDNVVGAVESFTWTQLKDMMKTGELNDGETITALTLAGFHLDQLK
jgi:8-oxo-dGTP pyrophosphatase MutT (NUDIX family)